MTISYLNSSHNGSAGTPGPPGPPGGGSSGPPGDLGPQGPPRWSFMWQSGSAIDQSIADMNRSVMWLLAVQQAASAQLQLQMQQNQAVQIAHTDGLRSLAESMQQRKFDHIFMSILIYYGMNKEGFFEWVESLEAACMQSRRDIC